MANFISYTDAAGRPAGINADTILRVESITDGSALVLNDGSRVQTKNTAAAILSLLDALRSGSSYLTLTDGVTAPGAVAGGARIYVDTSDGDLKIVYSDGTVKLIVIDT